MQANKEIVNEKGRTPDGDWDHPFSSLIEGDAGFPGRYRALWIGGSGEGVSWGWGSELLSGGGNGREELSSKSAEDPWVDWALLSHS